MPRLQTCNESALSEATLLALEPVRMNGKLADVYLQFANGEPALRAYLVMEQALREGSLSERERECIKLVVSQITQCDYCLSIHTFKSAQAGIDKETQLRIRAAALAETEAATDAATGDTRIDMIVRLVTSLFRQPGAISDALFQQAREVGFSDENLVDICMAMSTIFFTNMTNHLNLSESSLPPAPNLS